MDRTTLFATALAGTKALQGRYPDLPVLVSIVRQLEYLIALDNGSSTDRSRLGDIILGVQAAREIEPLDDALAEQLYEVAERTKTM